MRSVPHRVVCLLGLDDGAFPRKAHRDGDDLMLADPHVGDRDTRTEDRQMLLDALLAATDRLIVTYTGNDERTNVAAPAGGSGRASCSTSSIARCASKGGGDARARVVVRHPLQPFDPRNFARGRDRARAAVELRPGRAGRGARDRRAARRATSRSCARRWRMPPGRSSSSTAS